MITMLYIMVIGVLVTTGAVYMLFTNTAVATTDELSMMARTAAESGVENALLRLIRNPSYTGETLTLDGGRTATVTVASSSSEVITSAGSAGSVTRRVQATIQYNQGILTVVSWKEIP